MPDHTKIIEACIRKAPHDEGAAKVLRRVLRGAADRAPVDALVEMAEAILAIRERDLRVSLECN